MAAMLNSGRQADSGRRP